jgi:nitrite reductase/ring-hydroxylating ferredoxin subunit
MGDYVTVADVADIPPGERIVVEYGRDWVVILNVDGKLYALEDQCSHEDYPLSDGIVDGNEIECVHHGARFDLATGNVSAPPALVPVKWYAVRVVGIEVQIAKP